MSTLRVLGACAAVLLAGCTAFEHPIVAETASPPDERLVGSWEGRFEEEDDVLLVVRENGSADVTVVGSDSDPKTETETDTVSWLASNIDGILIANLGLDAEGKIYWKPARYEVTQRDELRVYFCNDETWYDAVKSGALTGRADKGRHGPSVHVSATQPEVREFLRANRDKAFLTEPMVFRRKR